MAKVQKRNNQRVTKGKSKATKAKIDKLNTDLKNIENIKQLASTMDGKTKSILNAKSLQEDLTKQKQVKQTNKKVEDDILKQLDLLTGMEL